jgi:uncharacterized protein YecE (DUF72 family)
LLIRHSASPRDSASCVAGSRAGTIADVATQTRIGISGWTYAPWRGVFFPEDVTIKRELVYASRQVNSIEINGTFYSLQRPGSFQAWYDETPDDFVFSVKGGRYITHLRRLKDVETPLANFFASGVLRLEEKLGPILWQFPPGFQFNHGRFVEFFDLLPTDTNSAVKLAKRHDQRLKGRSWVETSKNRPIRYAVEVRHDSFRDEAFVKLLRQHRIALCFADTAGKWPYMEDVTAGDFVYARLHGDEELYVSGYDDKALDWWAQRFRAWREGKEPADAKRIGPLSPKRARGRDVFCYFDNDVKVRAPFDAIGLARRLGVEAGSDGMPTPTDRDVKKVLANHPGAQPRTRWPGFGRRKRGRT